MKNEIQILNLVKKTNGKGQTYFALYYTGNNCEVFNTLNEALDRIPQVARFVTASVNIKDSWEMVKEQMGK